ncbi:unnamed protein product [Musa banksii]
MASGLINANPVVYERKERQVRSVPTIIDEDAEELIDQQEIFDILIFRTLLIIFFWGLCEQRVNSIASPQTIAHRVSSAKASSRQVNMRTCEDYSMPDNIQKPHPALCHSGGSRVLRWLTFRMQLRFVENKSWYVKMKPFWGSSARRDERLHCSVANCHCLQAKTHKTKAKHTVRSLYKHAKATNGSLNEVVAGAQRSFPWSSAYVYESCVPPRENFECKDIQDPEHPYTLEELKVVTEDSIEVNDKQSHVSVTFTPTVEHCSLATTIGLCLRVKLMRNLPSRYKVDIRVAPGTHATEAAVNKQLNDKERVVAALENPNLMYMIDRCLEPTFYY